jgi:fatty acid desaturase
MLIYWILATALVLNLVDIDPALMYSDYENPLVVAWNWSFFPIDIAFASLGLYAKYGRVERNRKFKFEVTAATLMVCAGLMAISYWIITGDFSPTWWAMNIWLIVLGLANLISSKR